MVPKLSIARCVPAPEPITEPVTKLGGQPVWVEAPQWPLSATQGVPMLFVCQVAIDGATFPGSRAEMAYVFLTDWPADPAHPRGPVPDTWDAEGGENAIVLQPGTYEGPAPVCGDATGPSLYIHAQDLPVPPPQSLWESVVRRVAGYRPPGDRLAKVPCEYRVELVRGEDPDFIADHWARDEGELPAEEWDRYCQEAAEDKIGGIPLFAQDDQFPQGGPWRLLFQLHDGCGPSALSLGGDGLAYGFIDDEGLRARMLCQR